MTIHETVEAYYGGMTGPHDRYRSWEHCYRYFHASTPDAIAKDQHHAALQLGFYLASWGMYRGSSFLLQHAYTAHLGVIDQLVAPRFSGLWGADLGAGGDDEQCIPVILEAVTVIREAYRPFAPRAESRQASDTLVTKVLLGTFGCLPACDRFFIYGFKASGAKYSYVNSKFIERIISFCHHNLGELQAEQQMIERAGGIRYPLMKIADMHFWQIGFDIDVAKRSKLTKSKVQGGMAQQVAG